MRTLLARLCTLLAVVLMSSSAFDGAQNAPPRPPVIDMHAHLTVMRAAELDALNVRYVLLLGDREGFAKLETMANRYLPALRFPCPDGREPLYGRSTCYSTGTEFPDLAWVRREVQAGRIKAFGEVLPQALGIAPGDVRMEA